MIPLLGFAPDLDPTTPGVLVDVTNVVPTKRGFAAGPGATTVASFGSYPEASITTAGLFGMYSSAVEDTTYTVQYRTVFASAAYLRNLRYNAGNQTYATCSPAVGLPGLVDSWHFAEYNGSIYAAIGNYGALGGPRILSTSGSMSTFGTIAAAPVAGVIVSCSDFLVALNTSTYSNGWYCSALYDTTDWTTSIATQCAKGQVIDGDGPFTAAIRFNNDIVAFKVRSMHIGRYVGSPSVWQWTTISTSIGCVGKHAVCDTPEGIVFVANTGVYLYDGTQPRQIDGPVNEWIADSRTLDPTLETDYGEGNYINRLLCRYLEDKHQVWIMYPNRDADSPTVHYTYAVVFNTQTKKWGKYNFKNDHKPLWVDLMYTASVLEQDGQAGDAYRKTRQMAYLNRGDLKLYLLDGTAGTASFTTGDWGDDDVEFICDRLSVRYLDKPDSSTSTGYYKASEGDSLTTAGTVSAFTNGHYDHKQAGRFHRFKVTTVGDMEVTAIRPRIKKAGAP